MEVSIKTIILFSSVILTGLSAGLFYAWSVSVIPGTQKISDTNYLETMQSINREILNPRFFISFFGALLLLGIASILEIGSNRLAFGLITSATLCYLLGTVCVTGLGNVPLNNQLDALNLSTFTDKELADFRHYYETKWNRLHLIRTVFAGISFLLALLSVFAHIKDFNN